MLDLSVSATAVQRFGSCADAGAYAYDSNNVCLHPRNRPPFDCHRTNIGKGTTDGAKPELVVGSALLIGYQTIANAN
jgi:hypothetical protein